MNYLIDSDWIIDCLHGVERTTLALEELASEGLAVSILSIAEVYEGVYASRDPGRAEAVLRQFLHPEITVLGIDDETARLFGRERSRLRRAGQLIGDMDLLIAATGLRHHLTVLPNNRRHFEVVEGLAVRSI